MTVPFSPEHITRLRDGARRLARKAGQHEDDVRKLLLASESRLDQSRIACSKHDAEPADVLSQVLQAHLHQSAADVASTRQISVSAREHSVAAQRLGADLNGEESPPSEPASATAVLIVDDYEDSREWLALVLQNAGFLVRAAANGLEAVLIAHELRPAVVIMDVMMPVLDGVEAARLINALDDRRAPHMIAYTARMPQPVIGELFAAVLRKPAPPDVVVETIKRLAAA